MTGYDKATSERDMKYVLCVLFVLKKQGKKLDRQN